MSRHELDVSQLPAPEPFTAICAKLTEMSPGDRLEVRHRRQPFPLFDILRECGYPYRCDPLEGGEYRITIEVTAASRPLPPPPDGTDACICPD